MSLITMHSWKYFFVVFFNYIPNALGSVQADLLKDAERARNLIAFDDTFQLFQQVDQHIKGFGEKWIVMPDGDGRPFLAMIDDNTTESAKSRFVDDEKIESNVKFLLFTSSQREGEEIDLSNLNSTKIDFSKPLKIICHGWMADSNSSVVTRIRNAYLTEHNVNVIAVDWSYFSRDFLYPRSIMSLYPVATYLGRSINELVSTQKARYEDIHIIGHSLGAHVAGHAGSLTEEKIGRITGLDPALPGFHSIQGGEGILDSTDANFVDVIHTCSGLLGMSTPVGHVDFYPNGGSPLQPGCDLWISSPNIQACSHSRSHEFFSESIYKNSQFSAVKCKDWNHFKSNQCEDVYTTMGEFVSKDSNGVFYLTTNPDSPFSKGLNGTVF